MNSLAWTAPLAFALGVSAAVAQSLGAQSLGTYEGADRMERIVAAAKKEGSLTLYTSFAEKDLPALIKPFETLYGVKVNVWRASSAKVLQRTLAEAAAKRYEVDALHISSPEMEALHRERVLAPVSSPTYRELMPGAVPAHREWVATLLTVWVQAYNTNAVRREELPKSYRDLLDPKWKGKLGIEATDQDWFATVAAEIGGDAGVGFFRDLAAKNGVSLRQGHALLNNLVVSGEVPLALTVYNYMPEQAKRKGAPIDWFAIEPAVARTNAIGVARRARHPAAALLFHEYMIGEAQPLLAPMDYVASNTKVSSPLKGMKIQLIDPATALDEMEKWTKIFNETLGKRGPS